MCCDDIKKSMINPLLVFEHIIGMHLPDDCIVYSSTVYMTLHDLFNEIFANMSIDQLNNVLVKQGISDDILVKISNNKRNSIKWFCQIMEIIMLDVLKIQQQRCYDLRNNQKINELKSDYGKLLPILSIDESILSAEINNNSLFTDTEYSNKIAEIISISISNIVDALLNIRKKGSDIMSKFQYADDVVTELDHDPNGRTLLRVLEKDKIGVNDDLRKRLERELRLNVNSLDRDSGVDLNKPSNTIETEDDLFDIIMNYRVILSRIVLMLNDVDNDIYINKHTIFGTSLQRIKMNSKFKNMSRLFDDIRCGPNSKWFISRFLTHLYIWVIKNLDIIANKCYTVNNDGPFIELDAKLSYVELVVDNLSELTHALLIGSSYEKYLLFFNDIQIYLKTNKRNYKKNMKKIDNIAIQGEILSYNLRKFSGASQDISMDTLLKLAYLVSVSSYSAINVVEFSEGYKFKNSSNTRYLIEQLGRSIIEDSRKYGLQKMFKFFICSDPLIQCSINNQTEELSVGILALKYYSFLVNDRRVNKIVSKII